MTKRYTFEDDCFIVDYYDGVGSFIGPHDLGRSQASVISRAAKLKKQGGWAAIERMNRAKYEYEYLMHPEAHGYMDDPFGVVAESDHGSDGSQECNGKAR